MFVNKVLFLMFGLLIVAGSTLCAAEREERYLDKKNALSLKIGPHFYENSDFMDDWKIDEQDLDTFAYELSYERKTSRNKGIEFSLGYSSSSATSEDALGAHDSFKVDIESFYLSPTVKRYLPFKDSFLFFGGIGADFYYTNIDLKYKKYKTGSNSQNEHERFFALGLHGLAGAEYYLLKRLVRNFHNSGVFDRSVSILLQYKYTWVRIKDADKVLLDDLASDLQVGGHMVFVGVRWHF